MKTKSHFLCAGLALGLIHSSAAQLMITIPPQNQTVIAGQTATFTVGAIGAEPLRYQWRSYSGTTTFTNIPFGTESMLGLTNVEYTTRRFVVVVTDASGMSATSGPPAFLTWLLAISSQPADQIVDTGASVTFTAAAIGTAPLAYQWRFNDAALVNQTNRSLALVNAQSTNAGQYSFVVTNVYGSLTSRVARLTLPTVHRFERITANPDHTISLNLAGVVPRVFAPYYDIYPLDASTNLVDWSPFAMLLRTNVSLDAWSHLDSNATNFDKRFYRTPTNFLVSPLPKPSGPYPVGTVSRLLTDPSRTNRYDIPTNSSFMVQFWYPAAATTGMLPESFLEQKLIEADPSYFSAKPASALIQLKSHAVPGLSLATDQIRYPVVLYSSTWGGRRQNTDKALELASHGYVVVAVDHPFILASVFPNGQVVYGSAFSSPSAVKTEAPLKLVDGIKDLLFVLDELDRLNTNDALLAGRLDLERLGIFGFSLGSMVAAEFCRIEPRCKAVAIFDSGWILEAATNLTRLGLPKPFLSMNSTGGWIPSAPGFGGWLDAPYAFFSNAVSRAVWFQIQNTTHHSFSDGGSLIGDPDRTGDPTSASREQSRTIRACTLSFFGKYLKNQDDHLLDNPAAAHPNIINFQSKP